MQRILTMLAAAALLVLALNLTASAGDKEFEFVAKAYLEELLEANPEWATQLGDHRYDHKLADMSATAIAARAEMNRSYLVKLEAIVPESLNRTNNVDYRIMKSNLARMVFETEELKTHEWNPLAYNMGGAIYGLVARDFAPLEDRLRNVAKRLDGVPQLLEQARANLKNPPKIHTETAILQNNGNISLIRDELSGFLEQAPSVVAEVAPAQDRAIAALEAYGKWLEGDLLPRSTGDFRLGDELFRKKLRFSLDSDLSKQEILQRAQADLKATQKHMHETALPLYQAYYPEETDETKLGDIKHVCKMVLDKLAETRPTNETIVDLARKTVVDATEFTRKHKLVSIPDEPIKLIVMPEFQRGVAVAYCDAPGPLEKNAETFYAIAPTPESWTPQRRESFFKEYNDHMVNDLTVHEAMPGHYLQLAHSNRFEAPTMIRSVFHSGSFVEGWAVYSERIMAEAGYGGPEVRMQQLKMRLRVIINAIIDQKIHTDGMTEDEAIAIMMDEGFQEDGEAAGKWRRACLTSTQLSTYFVGSAEVRDIRESYQAKHNDVDLQSLHDKMISFGSPSPKYVRELMGL